MRERVEQWLRARPLVVDTLIAGLLAVYPVMLFIGTREWQYVGDLALILALVLRRVAPVTGFTMVSLMLFAQVFVDDGPRYGDIALLFALYAIAAYGPTWARWGGLATGFLGALLATADWFGGVADASQVGFGLVMLGAVVLVAWTLGAYMRTRRSYVAGLEERAMQLERDAAQQAQLAAAAERSRIAREMHDVVAHSLSVIVVQADGALYASQRRPEAAPETLGTISTTARESLTQMRQLLGLLRSDESAEVVAGHDALAPAPSSADLPDLLERVRSSGLAVTLTTRGDLGRVGPAAGLTVYRVVQEALTNTLKHGGPDVEATVVVAVVDGEVVVQVDDDGRGVDTAYHAHGYGIVGIRERIAVHAGTIDAGPRVGGGFAVRASIPLDERMEGRP